MRSLRFGQMIWVTATALLAGGVVACSDDVDTPGPGGRGGSSGSTANAGSSGSGSGGSSGTANGGTSSGGTSNGGTSSGGTSNGGTSSGGTSNGGTSNNNGGTAGDEPDAGFEPDSGTDPEADAGGDPEPDAGPTIVNLVANFDAEAGAITPWIAAQGGTIAIATDQFNSGSQSVVTVGRAQTYEGVGVELFGLVEHGKVYDASVFMRVNAASTDEGRFTARITCDGSPAYNPIQQVAVSSTSWTELSGTFTVPTELDCPNMTSVLVFVENIEALIEIYADDMVVTEQAD